MSRRRAANGTGSWYYDETRKLYTFRVTAGYQNGKPRRKTFSGKTQEAVTEKYTRWQALGSFASVDPQITLEEWADKWYADYSTKVEASTAASYAYTKRHIVDRLGHLKVHEIKASQVEEFVAELAQKGYSQSLCGKCRAMLGQMLRKAEANGITAKNPVPLADRLNYRRMAGKKKAKSAGKDAFSVEEITILMQRLPDTRMGHSVKLMIGAGLSTQELLGLSMFDVAPDGSTVEIRRAVKTGEHGKMYIGDPKAELRERTAQVPPAARPSAVFLREHSKGYLITSNIHPDMPIHPSTYRKFYREMMKNIPVRKLSPHCCRHTYISHLQDKNVDFAVIQAMAGQREKSSTIQYIHPQSPAIQSAVDIINGIMTPKKTEK